MDEQANQSTNRCSKLLDLPPVLADWQQMAWCPDCEYYDCGLCSNPIRRIGNAACPFDGRVLPLREVAVEAPSDQLGEPLDSGSCEVPAGPPWCKELEQAIRDRIVNRTGGRMRALVIELTDRELIVRGSTPCYYVKQLALQGVLDVLYPDHRTKIECNFQIVVRPPGPPDPTAPVGEPSSSPEAK